MVWYFYPLVPSMGLAQVPRYATSDRTERSGSASEQYRKKLIVVMDWRNMVTRQRPVVLCILETRNMTPCIL